MHSNLRLVAASLLAFGAACASSSTEEPPAATAIAATEGAEAPSEAAQAPPAPAAEAPPEPPAQPEPPAAQPVQPPAPEMPPYAAVVIHQVKDFDAWKSMFDSRVEARKEAGVIGEGVMRGTKDDKTVVVYLPAADAEQLKALLASKELEAKRKEAGVKGKPTVLVFKDEGGKMAPPDKTGLYGAIVQYKVKDFAAFKAAIEAHEEVLSNAGVLGWGLGQSVDSETDAFLYLQSENPESLEAYLSAKETKQAMKDAGVRGQPKTVIVQEGSMTMYR